jgi:hypothetical protein
LCYDSGKTKFFSHEGECIIYYSIWQEHVLPEKNEKILTRKLRDGMIVDVGLWGLAKRRKGVRRFGDVSVELWHEK